MLINILFFILIVLRLWIAMRLVATAHDTGVSSLNWLGVAFFIFALCMPFAGITGSPLGATPASPWLYQGIFSLADIAAIIFVNTTFYQGRKSPMHWFLGLATIGMVATFYGIAISPSNYYQNPWVATGQVVTCLVWGWQGWAGYQVWRSVAKEHMVEDWVKARYQLVVWYSVFQVIGNLVNFLRILFGIDSPVLSNAMGLISLVTSIANVVLAYLAWAAPASFYRWLNRNYKPLEVMEMPEEALKIRRLFHAVLSTPPEVSEISEEELMRQMTRG